MHVGSQNGSHYTQPSFGTKRTSLSGMLSCRHNYKLLAFSYRKMVLCYTARHKSFILQDALSATTCTTMVLRFFELCPFAFECLLQFIYIPDKATYLLSWPKNPFSAVMNEKLWNRKYQQGFLLGSQRISSRHQMKRTRFRVSGLFSMGEASPFSNAEGADFQHQCFLSRFLSVTVNVQSVSFMEGGQ